MLSLDRDTETNLSMTAVGLLRRSLALAPRNDMLNLLNLLKLFLFPLNYLRRHPPKADRSAPAADKPFLIYK